MPSSEPPSLSEIHYSGELALHPYPTGEDLIEFAQPPFRVWIPHKPILVLGYSQMAAQELNLENVRRSGIPVYRRKGGGGTVLLTPEVVCVGIRMPRKPEMAIQDYFSIANGLIQSAFKKNLGLDLKPKGISDLAWNEKKVLGSSMYLPKNYALYLASILVNCPMNQMESFLKYPSREPDYRLGRPHSDFLQNLGEIPGMEFLNSNKVEEILKETLSSLGERV